MLAQGRASTWHTLCSRSFILSILLGKREVTKLNNESTQDRVEVFQSPQIVKDLKKLLFNFEPVILHFKQPVLPKNKFSPFKF